MLVPLSFSIFLLQLWFCTVDSLSHYETLGVKKNAKPKEIKAAFRALALKTHPDKNPGEEAAKQFSEISLAYETLSDTRQRQIYDAEQNEQRYHQQHHHHHHHQQQRRGNQGRHFIFRQNGRTFVFTEEEYYAQQQNGGQFGNQFHHQNVGPSDYILPLLKNLLIFGFIFLILRNSIGGEDDDDHGQNNERRTTSSSSTNNKNKNDEDIRHQQIRKTFKQYELARIHSPHINYFELRYLKQRGRRQVIFLPKNLKNILEWQTYEQIALSFLHDRLSFFWLSLEDQIKWKIFFLQEYSNNIYNEDDLIIEDQDDDDNENSLIKGKKRDPLPLIVVFGSSGTKRIFYNCEPEDLPISSIGSLKERICRWLETIVEGTQELTITDNDLPSDTE